MITKEQALTATRFIQIAEPVGTRRTDALNFQIHFIPDYTLPPEPLAKAINWRANGACKLWKLKPDKFRLPIKSGLRAYAYLTEENAHLFELAE